MFINLHNNFFWAMFQSSSCISQIRIYSIIKMEVTMLLRTLTIPHHKTHIYTIFNAGIMSEMMDSQTFIRIPLYNGRHPLKTQDSRLKIIYSDHFTYIHIFFFFIYIYRPLYYGQGDLHKNQLRPLAWRPLFTSVDKKYTW